MDWTTWLCMPGNGTVVSDIMRQHLPNLKMLPFGGAGAVTDPTMVAAVQEAVQTVVHNRSWIDEQLQYEFVDVYSNWVQSTKHNLFKGLEAYPYRVVSNGTTEGFDKFYINNHSRRFRIFRGEYMYHAASWKDKFQWAYIDDDKITSNDAVIISMPFSDTGNVHDSTVSTLDICAELGVPVLIDCAFIGLCSGIEFDFDHEAITDITFSLSKTFPISSFRIGMRYTKQDTDDGLLVHQKTNYTNRIGAAVALELLKQYDCDHNWNRWHHNQNQFCQELSVEPSHTVIFGLGSSQWQQYNRGGVTNRLCFNRYLASGLPHD